MLYRVTEITRYTFFRIAPYSYNLTIFICGKNTMIIAPENKSISLLLHSIKSSLKIARVGQFIND